LTQLSIAPLLLILCGTILLILPPARGDITTLTREQVDKKCDASENYLNNLEECDRLYEIVENNEAGDHYIGPDNPAITEDLDRESDLGYNELCDYNSGEWKDNKCEFDDDEKEKKYDNKLDAYHDTNPDKLKEDLDKQDKGQFEVVKCDDSIIYDRDSTNCDEEGKGYEFVICNGVEYPKGTECEDIKNNLE
jgi:hypothetical protein